MTSPQVAPGTLEWATAQAERGCIIARRKYPDKEHYGVPLLSQLNATDLFATDWYIVRDPDTPPTPEQLRRWAEDDAAAEEHYKLMK